MAGDPQRAAAQHAAQQRVHQAQLAQQAQQRAAQQRQAQQAQQRAAQQRQAQQAQQRAVQQRQAQQRQAQQRQAQQRQAQRQAQQRQAQQRLRVWQRTAAKRAARQVETELAIEERQERQRVYAAATSYADAATGESFAGAAIEAPLHIGRAALRRLYMQAPVDVGDLDRPLAPPRRGRFGRLPWPPWSRAARERRRADADAAYQAAVAEYETAEFDRVRRLSTAKRDHQRSQAETADRLWADYRAGERDAVATYAAVVLASRAGEARHVEYEPGERLLTVEHDAADPRQALSDLFGTLDEELVDAISINGVTARRPDRQLIDRRR